MFLDEGIMFKVSPSPGLNLTHLRTIGPSTCTPSQENRLPFSGLHTLHAEISARTEKGLYVKG